MQKAPNSVSPSRVLKSQTFTNESAFMSTNRKLRKSMTYDNGLEQQYTSREEIGKKYRLVDEAVKYQFLHKPFEDKTIKQK